MSRCSRRRATSTSPICAVNSGNQPAGSSSHPSSRSSSRSITIRSQPSCDRSFAALAAPRRLLNVGVRDADREPAHPEDVVRALGHADAVARIENIEEVRALLRVFEGWPHEPGLQERLGHAITLVEHLPMEGAELALGQLHTRVEHVLGLLDLLPIPDLAVADARRPLEIEDAVDALQHLGDALQPVGELRGDWRELQTARLLEVGKLRDLLAVEHHLPSDAPCAERRRLPVVFLEPDVVLSRVDSARFEAFEVHLLDIVGGGLEDDLKLIVLEEAVRVLAEAPVGRPAGRLDVGDIPVRRTQHAEKRLRVHRARADLDVKRLLQRAAARRPEFGQLQDEALECHRRISRRTRADFKSFSRCIAMRARCAFSSSTSVCGETERSPSAKGLRLRTAGRNARASDDSRASGSYTPCNRSSQYSKYRASGSTGTPSAIASTMDAPSRNMVSFGSASGAHSSISSAKYPA